MKTFLKTGVYIYIYIFFFILFYFFFEFATGFCCLVHGWVM